jgi:hypothetical protein
MLSIATPDAAPSTVNPDKIHISAPRDPSEPHKKKKKKRHREDESTATGDDEHREKKKKRKHHERTEDAIEQQEPASATTMPVVDASPAEPEPILKKKKKKKDKGKERADVSLMEPSDAQIEADSQASAAALLSAIVAASVTNPDNQQTNQQMQFQQNPIAPAAGQQFVQFPPVQYGYPPGAFDPNLPQAANLFAPPGGAAFSELSFGSNEDLLRALQDLDMSKIANVLKTIGDASNPQPANGVSFAPQLGFMPSQLEQVQPTNPRPASASSNTIIGAPEPPRLQKQTFPAVPGQHGNPDHAHLLANKWLTASKLTELVAQEGVYAVFSLGDVPDWRYSGLVYKKGKFSTIEQVQVNEAIERYQVVRVCTSY